MTDWIYKNEPEFKNYPLIFHDVYFHAKVSKFELYSEIDSLYSSFIMRFIKNLKEQKLIDNFEKALRESAIDCKLFYNRNVYKNDVKT